MARKKIQPVIPAPEPVLVKIENAPDLARDISSKAIVNVNKSAYHVYMAKKREEAEKTREIADLKSRIARLEELVSALASK